MCTFFFRVDSFILTFDLYSTLRSSSEYLRFDLDHDEVVVVSRKDAMECSAEILETHCIPAAKSIGPLPSNLQYKEKDANKLRPKKFPNPKRNVKVPVPGDGRANGLPKRNQNKRAARKPNKRFGDKNAMENGAENSTGDSGGHSMTENKSTSTSPQDFRTLSPHQTVAKSASNGDAPPAAVQEK